MTDTTKKPTAADAAELAISECGAPEDIRSYRWIDADQRGGMYGSIHRLEANVRVPMKCYHTTTYGTVGVGWDVAKRIAIYSWEPSE